MRELSSCDFCDGPAAGVYEVVPDDVSGVSSRRMVLCDDCRDTLSTVVDPLLAVIPDGAVDAGGTGGATAGVESDTPGPATETAAEPESSSAPGREATSEPEPEREPESELSPEREPELEPTSASGEDEQDATGNEPSSKPDPGERPEGYGKVVRLVENRDEGITRRDLEELASGAYDLSPSEVEEAIEFAVERGTFAETDSGLETT